jgi:hypothetical protein
MLIRNIAILADASTINELLYGLHDDVFKAQQEAERSLAASRRSFEQAADAASFMVEDEDHDALRARLDHVKHLTNDAIGHRQDAYIALGIALDKQAEISRMLDIHPEEED